MRTFKIAVLLGLGATVAFVAVIKLHTQQQTPSNVSDIASGPSQPIDKWLETLGTGRRFADRIARAPENADAFLSLAVAEPPPRLAARPKAHLQDAGAGFAQRWTSSATEDCSTKGRAGFATFCLLFPTC